MGKRVDIMLASPLEEKRFDRWSKPVVGQPKMDGERCKAYYEEGIGWRLFTSEARELVMFPHIETALEEQLGEISSGVDGELYKEGWSWNQIHSVVGRSQNVHEDAEQLEYWIFDFHDGRIQVERLLDLLDLNLEWPLVRVPVFMVWKFDEALELGMALNREGYEGIVLRKPDGYYDTRGRTQMMKFKPRKTDDYRIVDVQEEVSKDGEPKGSLGALICTSNEEEGGTFRVGTGFTQLDRRLLWAQRETLPGRFVRVHYQHLTPGKRKPRSAVYVRLL